MSEQHNHDGHRQRLKTRVKKYGLESLEDHEKLELLLSYPIKRKDTNPLAHELINTFGSLYNVINADVSALKHVKGVGEETALFIKTLKEFVDIYFEKTPKGPAPDLSSLDKFLEYFNKHFRIKQKEYFYCFCLNTSGKLIHYFTQHGQDDTHIEFPFRAIMDNVSQTGVKQAIIVHTHPNGMVSPSREDIQATERIQSICHILGVRLIDHIIFNESEHYSFNKTHGLEPITLDYAHKVVRNIGLHITKR